MIKYIFLIVIFCGSFFGCTRKGAPLTSTMHTEAMHHKWRVTSLKEYESPIENLYLDLRDVYKAGAYAGCDTLHLTPRFGYNDRVAFSDVKYQPSDTANCGNLPVKPVMQALLEKVWRFKVTKTTLNLFDRSGAELLSATLANDDEDGSLQRKWYLTEMINANTDTLQLVHAYIDLSTSENGNVFAGCNQLRFSYNADADYTIKFGNVLSTRKFCRGLMNAELVFEKALPLSAKYQVIGNKLKLFDKDNVLLLEGVAALK